jgi:diguanylate cyclase (GGDEF)-like protein
LRDAKDEFMGAVFVQLRDDEFQGLNIYQSDGYPICYLLFQRDGLLALQIPTDKTCYTPQFEKQLYQVANQQPGKVSGDTQLSSDTSIDGHQYQVAFDNSVVFNMTVVASLQKKFIFWHFYVPAVATVTLISLVCFLIISILFFHLYRYLVRYEEVHDESMTDQLTSLSNRRSMDGEFPALWKRALEKGGVVSVLFIDIDHFKVVNDSYGHETGDDVLKAVAHTIRGCVARPGDLVCRWGGEEFVVALDNTAKDGAVVVAQRIMEAIRRRAIAVRGDILRAGNPIKVTVSVGIASIVVTPESADTDLIDLADKAMLQAKEAGRNCYRVWKLSS